MDKAPDADREVMTDPNWQAAFVVSTIEPPDGAFGDHEGHFAGYHRDGEILDELLARG